MSTRNILLLGLVVLFAAGCVSPTKVDVRQGWDASPGERFAYEIDSQAEVSGEGLQILDDKLQALLEETHNRAPAETTRSVDIVITDYRMRHGALRYFFGWWAGADHIVSDVTVSDANSGEVLGESTVHSRTSGGGSARALIEDHAKHIVRYLESGGEGMQSSEE